MDDKGFIFTADAAMALIPLFIIIVAIANLNSGGLISGSQHIRIAHDAQDTLDVMANYKSSANSLTVLQNITFTLEYNNNNQDGITESGQIAGLFLNNTLPGMKYNLTETNQLNGKTIACNGDMKNAENIAIGVKSYGNYIFKLYVWD